jgi:TPR repeat protein
MFRRLVLSLLLLCIVSPAAGAAEQSYAAGKQAYINGDYQRAYDILSPLAADGNADAQKMLGIMYDYGQGVKKDPKKALDWYLKAASQNQPAAQLVVGTKYFRGDGTRQDYAEAAKWWEMAATGGQIEAQFNLGLMYYRGLGVTRDDGKAAELFRAAAEQGHAHAQYSLAVMYAFGRGVPKNYQTALKWFSKAAKQGVAQAQFNLGVFYEKGYGVNPDPAMAAKWYQRAAAQGLEEAETKLAALDSRPAGETLTDAAPGVTTTMDEPATADSMSKPALKSKTGTSRSETASAGIRTNDWVLQQPADNYTLQIGSITREQTVIDFIRKNGIEAESAYIKVVIKGRTRYNCLYGNYTTYEEAKQASRKLRVTLGGVKPWIRNFGMLQKMLK